MSIRAGIIGTGGISRAHVRAYRNNGVDVTALMEIGRASCRERV